MFHQYVEYSQKSTKKTKEILEETDQQAEQDMDNLKQKNEELVAKLKQMQVKFQQDFKEKLEDQIKQIISIKDESLVSQTKIMTENQYVPQE